MKTKIKLTGERWTKSDMGELGEKTGNIIEVILSDNNFFIFKGREWQGCPGEYAIEVQKEASELENCILEIEKQTKAMTEIIAVLKTVDRETAVWIVKYLSEKVLK